MSSGWKFQVIQETLREDDNLLNISMLCDIAGVSRSGYYRWIKAEDVRREKENKDRESFDLILKAYIHLYYYHILLQKQTTLFSLLLFH
ncbi:MAG: hypothetical protein Q607_CBUC00171G0002 [Clostridium butyricum DORA_1]|nr:MAG: hypothetical protein Q607_CBUC00171G0002 [Clostridium butyricum DORA_1]